MKNLVVALILIAAVPAVSGGPDTAIALPDKDWRIDVTPDGFEMRDTETRSDGQARKIVFFHENGRYGLTVVMKPAEPGIAAEVYRDDRWARLQSGGPAEENPRSWMEGERAFFEYFLETPFKGEPLHQKHIHTFLLHSGYRAEIHVSVSHFRKKDQAWLDEFQESIRIVDGGDLESD